MAAGVGERAIDPLDGRAAHEGGGKTLGFPGLRFVAEGNAGNAAAFGGGPQSDDATFSRAAFEDGFVRSHALDFDAGVDHQRAFPHALADHDTVAVVGVGECLGRGGVVLRNPQGAGVGSHFLQQRRDFGILRRQQSRLTEKIERLLVELAAVADERLLIERARFRQLLRGLRFRGGRLGEQIVRVGVAGLSGENRPRGGDRGVPLAAGELLAGAGDGLLERGSGPRGGDLA